MNEKERQLTHITLTRREALALAAGGLIGIVLGFRKGVTENETQISFLQQELATSPTVVPSPTVDSSAELRQAQEVAFYGSSEFSKMYYEGQAYTSEILKGATKYMTVSVASPDREAMELDTLQTILSGGKKSSAADLLYFLQSAATIPARDAALIKLWDLRQSGELSKYNVQPLSDAKVAWAAQNGVKPDVLAVAEDAFHIAQRIVQKNSAQFKTSVDQNSVVSPGC